MFLSGKLINMLLKKFNKALEGATAIEYAIIASLLSVFIIIGVEATGVAVKDKYEFVGSELEDAFQASAGGNKSTNLQQNPDSQ